MKKYNLSCIMKMAWVLVKKANATMSAALKFAWKRAKEMVAENEVKTIVIPNWFFVKKFGILFGAALKKGIVLKETEKAYLVKENGTGEEMWVPKSIVK